MIIYSKGLVHDICWHLKSNDQKIVSTNGCFDVIHAGHVDYLRQAKAMGDVLVVGINTDDSVKRIKGEDRPFIPCKWRARMLDTLTCVDIVIPFEEDDPIDLLTHIQPDVHVKGSDWATKHVPEQPIIKEHGGCMAYIPFRHNVSTTKLMENQCPTA